MGSSNSNLKLNTNSNTNLCRSTLKNNYFQKKIATAKMENRYLMELKTFNIRCGTQRFKFFIEETSLGQIKYIHDGEIIRIENRIEQQQKSNILTNLEQIKNLKWEGQNGSQDLPIGEKQIVGSNYNHSGVKEGKWLEPFEGFWDLCQIFFVGIYFKGLKQGRWFYQYEEDIIGGGFYNQNGEKEGQWIELHENFNKNCQMKIQGDYKNNKKNGNWVYEFRKSSKIKLKKIPGGIYNQDGLKHGKWIDLWQAFDDDLQYLNMGEYNLGKKQGIWNAMQIKLLTHHQTIGCGVYDENELENGCWLQLDKIQRDFRHNTISHGQYVNGRKIGTWKTVIQDQLIGIGSYNQEGKRDGKWIHFPKNCNMKRQVLQVKSNLSLLLENIKIIQRRATGKFKREMKQQEEVNIMRVQKIDAGLIYETSKCLALLSKRDNIKKVSDRVNGRLYTRKTKYKKIQKKEGIYDNQGMKHGKWISLYDHFNYNSQVLDVGYYNHGMKQGRWDVKTINYYEHDVLTYPFWPKDNFYIISQLININLEVVVPIRMELKQENGLNQMNSIIITYKYQMRESTKMTQSKDNGGGGYFDEEGLKILNGQNWIKMANQSQSQLNIKMEKEYALNKIEKGI